MLSEIWWTIMDFANELMRRYQVMLANNSCSRKQFRWEKRKPRWGKKYKPNNG